MKIIIINGSPRSGKDSFVEFAKNGNYEVYNFSTIDFIKEKAYDLGWDGQKDERGRRLLSDLKDALSLYDNIPFKAVIQQINYVLFQYEQFEQLTDNLIFFIHSREPEDIEKWKELTNAKTLFIRRPAAEDVEHNNHADKRVYDYDYDYVYANDSDLKKLEEDAINFVNWIGSKDWTSTVNINENHKE